MKQLLLNLLATFTTFYLQANPECLYDRSKDFAYNCTKDYPDRPVLERNEMGERTFLGYPIASPIGIPACAIMTSPGIEWASKAGYDILTYKTVRSRPFNGHPLPNILVVETPATTPVNQVKIKSDPSFDVSEMTMANSMGIPSLSLDWVLQDIVKARACLLPGQVLIVSIIGNPTEERSLEEDFAALARAVVGVGAHVVEANLSCPNLHSPLATYKDPQAVAAIMKAIDEAVPTTPVVLKVGLFDSPEQMREVFKAAAASNAKGICGINAMPMQVVDDEGNPAFGPTRMVAGVSGEWIRPYAYDFVVQAHRIIQEEQLNLALLATGGVLKPEHFDLFLEAGADVALSATGAMWNPELAAEYHQKEKSSQSSGVL